MARRNAIAIVSVCLLVIIAGVFLLEVKQPGDITKKIGALAVILQGHLEAVTDIDQGEAVSKALAFMQAGDLANARIPVTGYRLSSAYHATALAKQRRRMGVRRHRGGSRKTSGYSSSSHPRSRDLPTYRPLSLSMPAAAKWSPTAREKPTSERRGS